MITGFPVFILPAIAVYSVFSVIWFIILQRQLKSSVSIS
jgi:hypothetical protein